MRRLATILLTVSLSFLFASCGPQVSYTAKKTVVIAANQLESKLIADLAQYYTGVTVILYQAPSSSMPEGKLYTLLPDRSVVHHSVEELPTLLYTYTAERVIIIGNNKYVPAKFEEDINAKLSSKVKTITRYGSEDWGSTAKEIGKLFLNERIGYEFPQARKKALAAIEDQETKNRLDLK